MTRQSVTGAGVVSLTVSAIKALFDAKGGRQYSGEAVTQLEHALQCAQFAEQHSADATLVTACLLHDVGHMTNDLGATPKLRGLDDRHQHRGAGALKGTFPDAVVMPIRLHVYAKRYLCAVERSYREGLSPDSRRSLELQGGVYDPTEASRFIALPYAQEAVMLRRWDDLAKVAGRAAPALGHYLEVAARCTV